MTLRAINVESVNIEGSVIEGSILNGGQVNGAVIQNTGNICKTRVDDGGVHILNNIGNGTQNIEKIKLTTYEYDGNGIIEFTNNYGQNAEITFSDNKLNIRSDLGISLSGRLGFYNNSPVPQQTAQLLPSDATQIQIINKINGLLKKLGDYPNVDGYGLIHVYD